MKSELTDRQRDVLDEYESYSEIDDSSTLYEYLQALTSLGAMMKPAADVTTNLMKVNGIANDVRDGEISVESAKKKVDEILDGDR